MLRARSVIFATCALLGASAAQAQIACEPKSSPRCRYVALCMAPPQVKLAGRPFTEEICSCLWDRFPLAFPAEDLVSVIDFLEAWAQKGGPRDKLKELFPDEAQAKAFARKVVNTMFSKPTGSACQG